ncbi:MAG TPA: c-type cytochrome [Terriglobales bacterium]|nr:c-type cytochrome [Terriglobales bacterium]
MKKWLIAICVIVLLALAGGAVWLHSASGFSAKAKPTWIEAQLAALSRRLALPGRENQIKNPFPSTPDRLAAAHQLYQTQCTQCHNSNGDGHTSLGQSMYPQVPDLRGLTQNKTDGALFYTIRNGVRMSGMPAWTQDSDQQLWELVDLIRAMRKP